MKNGSYIIHPLQKSIMSKRKLDTKLETGSAKKLQLTKPEPVKKLRECECTVCEDESKRILTKKCQGCGDLIKHSKSCEKKRMAFFCKGCRNYLCVSCDKYQIIEWDQEKDDYLKPCSICWEGWNLGGSEGESEKDYAGCPLFCPTCRFPCQHPTDYPFHESPEVTFYSGEYFNQGYLCFKHKNLPCSFCKALIKE